MQPPPVTPSAPDRRRPAPVRVLQSAQTPGPRTNPYLPLLAGAFGDGVEVRWFSWREALIGDFDVLHLHWPEVRLRGTTRLRSAANHLRFALMLARLRLSGRPIVRTLHNVAPHEPLGSVGRWLMRLCDKQTSTWIRLLPSTPAPGTGRVVTIPHGHYRSWYRPHPRTSPVPGRLLHVGLIRRYKGIDALLRAMAEVPEAKVELRFVGRVEDPVLGEELRAASAADPRITLRDEYVDDAALVDEVSRSSLVVLPHAAAGSSGTLLLAVSLDRPALVPDGDITRGLAAEVGDGWVITFEPPLRGATLLSALDRAARPRPAPDLSSRDWSTIGRAHEEVFRVALAASRHGRRSGASSIASPWGSSPDGAA